jgi:pimeloyl-ACP methyl ester carboxylesterase
VEPSAEKGGPAANPPEALVRVADAMSSPDGRALDEALDSLSADEWAALAGIIGRRGTRSVRSDRSRTQQEKHGHVVLLPGIMGTDLTVTGTDGLPAVVWLSVARLAGGGLAQLILPVDGAAPQFDVRPGGLMRLFYLPLQGRLGVNWTAEIFPYDWRLDIASVADLLAKRLEAFGDERVHLVAHSMGGLVSRAMIQRRPDVWDQMGGRLVMLGTPNLGSFAPVLAFTGRDTKLRALAFLDRKLKKDDVVRVVATFPGLYQMLPSKAAGLGADIDALYDRQSWAEPVVHQSLLDASCTFQESIADAVRPERMVYVAGYGHRTVDGIRRSNGKLEWRRSKAGDGTVPHSLGRLPGVTTFWSRAKHGSLPKDEQVLAALDDLLLSGATEKLDSGADPPGGRDADDPEWVDDDALARQVERQALAVVITRSDAELLGDVIPFGDDDDDVDTVPVRIEVVWDDIANAAPTSDVVAVGHYEHVSPTEAEHALDVALSGPSEERVFHEAAARGVLRGGVGEVNLFPFPAAVAEGSMAAVVGMGRAGTFGRSQHQVMVRNLLWTAERVGAKVLSTVLIGSGAANLSVDDAVSGLVRALDAAVRERDFTGTLKTVRIVEAELGRARAVHAALRDAVDSRTENRPAIVDVADLAEGKGGYVTPQTALRQLLLAVAGNERVVKAAVASMDGSKELRSKTGAVLRDIAPEDLRAFRRGGSDRRASAPTRLSLLAKDGGLCFSAISDSATISERPLGFDVKLFRDLVAEAHEEAAGDLAKEGQFLLELAVPSDFRAFLHGGRSLVVEVDRETAAVPWEVLPSFEPGGPARDFVGLTSAVARQLRTTLSPPPTVTGRVVLRRALVIGDPGLPGGGHRLAQAKAEAVAVAKLLRKHDVDVEFLLGPDGEEPDHPPATRAGVLHRLLHGKYDLVHFAGHATFSTGNSEEGSGWLFGDGMLQGSHLTMVSALPPLLVANACHSGKVSTGLPGLADEFMGRGVRNLVGTARAVADESGRVFSEAFYGVLLGSRKDSLGEAMLEGRTAINVARLPDWDVYQLYGDPGFRFVSAPKP